MISDIIAWSSSTQEQKFIKKSRRNRKRDRNSRSSTNNHKRQSILKAQEEEQKQIAEALSQNPEDLLKSFLDMQAKIKEMEKLQAMAAAAEGPNQNTASTATADTTNRNDSGSKSKPFYDPNPPPAPLLKDWSIVDGVLVYTPPPPPVVTIPVNAHRATASRNAAQAQGGSFTIRPEDLRMALRPVNKNDLNTAQPPTRGDGVKSAVFNKTLPASVSANAAKRPAPPPSGAMNFQEQLAQQLAIRNQKKLEQETLPQQPSSASTQDHPSDDAHEEEESQTVLDLTLSEQIKVLSVAGKRVEARTLPGEEYMSFSDRICVAAKMPLRSSGPKSPGGTPINRRRPSQETPFSEQLRKKFAHVRMSEVPPVDDPDWE